MLRVGNTFEGTVNCVPLFDHVRKALVVTATANIPKDAELIMEDS